MKSKYAFLIALAIVVSLSLGMYATYGKMYCGEVKKVYVKQIKGESDEYHILFYCYELKRNVDVEVAKKVFKEVEVKDDFCIELSRKDIKD